MKPRFSLKTSRRHTVSQIAPHTRRHYKRDVQKQSLSRNCTDAMLMDDCERPNLKLRHTCTQFTVQFSQKGLHEQGDHNPGPACRYALCGTPASCVIQGSQQQNAVPALTHGKLVIKNTRHLATYWHLHNFVHYCLLLNNLTLLQTCSGTAMFTWHKL